MSGLCRACKAEMVWALTVKGNRQPFDPEPTEEGTYLLEHKEQGKPPVARHQDAAARETLRRQAAARGEPLKLFVPHHATCPSRAQFRKGKSR